jgi:Ni,Fe-hydrogenase III large subunit
MVERNIALELERVAMHLADIGALSGDAAYQLGQVVCEALRTLAINSKQYWCGNRFGKGMIRPEGTNYPLTIEVADYILDQLNIIGKRFVGLTDRMFSLPSVLSRFENVGTLKREQAILAGLVGPAARSAGLLRDIRVSHATQAYAQHFHAPLVLSQGDVWARAMLRRIELLQSIDVIRMLIDRWKNNLSDKDFGEKSLEQNVPINSLSVSLIEGWRGEIAHVGITDAEGKLIHYKIKDPSFHNWTGLALSMREQQISDFPICNKSFNLSYCGFDL